MLTWQLCDFQGIKTSIAKKPYILVIFQGVRTPCPLFGSVHVVYVADETDLKIALSETPRQVFSQRGPLLYHNPLHHSCPRNQLFHHTVVTHQCKLGCHIGTRQNHKEGSLKKISVFHRFSITQYFSVKL